MINVWSMPTDLFHYKGKKPLLEVPDESTIVSLSEQRKELLLKLKDLDELRSRMKLNYHHRLFQEYEESRSDFITNLISVFPLQSKQDWETDKLAFHALLQTNPSVEWLKLERLLLYFRVSFLSVDENLHLQTFSAFSQTWLSLPIYDRSLMYSAKELLDWKVDKVVVRAAVVPVRQKKRKAVSRSQEMMKQWNDFLDDQGILFEARDFFPTFFLPGLDVYVEVKPSAPSRQEIAQLMKAKKGPIFFVWGIPGRVRDPEVAYGQYRCCKVIAERIEWNWYFDTDEKMFKKLILQHIP